ncbi:MAG TPA: hypothetical protein VHE35_36000 [Kofleriaceae bacterium]|nr:hypothetical protein [Kofleriaceae bacterium]
MLRAGVVALIVSAAAYAAHAQTPPAAGTGAGSAAGSGSGSGSGSGADAGAGAGSEVELEGDTTPADTGDEDEDAPKIGVQTPAQTPTTPKSRTGAYPITEVLRPLTLPDFTSEIRLEALFYPTPVDAEFALRARYGITRQVQLGLQYGIGGFYDDGKRDKVRFNTGKAVALDLTYLAADWIAPRLTVPMYVDPFAIGFVLGAPVKFRFGDRFAIVGLEDVVAFKVQSDKFLPDLRKEKANEAAVDELTSGTIQSDGFFRLDGGVLYQLAPDLVVSGRFGVTFNDFSGADAPTSLRALVQFTPIRTLDVVGEAGWDRLDENRGSIHLSAALAIRI